MSQSNPYDGQRIPPEGDSHDERIEVLEKSLKRANLTAAALGRLVTRQDARLAGLERKLEAATGFALDLSQKLDELTR